MMNASHNPNRSLVRIFGLSLGSLLVVHSAIAVHGLFQLASISASELGVGLLRIALGVAAVGVMFGWSRFDEPIERQVDAMGSLFEAGYEAASTKEKIRLIVLVTMVSLLLELVMIRWLASVFPVFSFFKNFTLLACFLGLARATRSPKNNAARPRWCCRCWRCSCSSSRCCATISAPRKFCSRTANARADLVCDDS